MGTKVSVRMEAEALRSSAFGAIGAAYTVVGSTFTNPIYILKIQNLTDASLLFSFDGSTDHDIIPAGSFALYDITSNKSNDTGIFLAERSGVYVKRSGVPTTGSVYVTAFYGAP